MILPVNFDFTQGNLQDFADCPYRFYLRYILQIQWPALIVNDALEFEERVQAGVRFHRLIQQFLLGVPEDRISEMAAEDPSQMLQIWLDGFFTNVPAWITGERSVEASFATTLAGQRLVAKFDLLLTSPDGSFTIFDWKTAKKPPRKEWLLERIQTRLYRFVLARAGATSSLGVAVKPEKISMSYWYASHPSTRIDLPYNTLAYEQDQAYFSALINEVSTSTNDMFQRTDDLQQCRFCVYRSHCDRGVEAGNLADFDDFDDEAENLQAEIAFENLPEIEF